MEGVVNQRREAVDPTSRGGRLRNLCWLTALLLFLAQPARSVPDQDPAWLAAVSLGGFAVLYVAVLAAGFCLLPGVPGGAGYRLRFAGLGVLAALGVVLSLAYAAVPGWGMVMILVAVAGIVTMPTLRRGAAWLAATIVVEAAMVAYLGGFGGQSPAQEWFWFALSTLLVGALTLSARRTEEVIVHLHRTRAELADAAVEAERSRFSRDLHDLLGHTLSLIVVKAEVARRSAGQDPPDPAAAAGEADEIERIGRRALSEVREAVTGYRDRSFAAELDTTRAALADAGLQVTVRTTGTPLPVPVDGLFGWVMREAATNVMRHSGARHCEIEVRRLNGRATLEVRDDGVGGEPRRTGRGLDGLAERVAEVGGQLEAGGSAAGGWRVAATVPVTSPEQP